MFSESQYAQQRSTTDKMLKVRAPKWTFDDLSPGQDVGVFARTLFHALSLVFPDGERFFIRSVNAYKDRITDPKLIADIKAFIGQEVQHGRVHEFYNEKIVGSRYEIQNYLKLHRWVNYSVIEPITNWLFSPKFSLSITAAAEHYTATWAHNALTDERVRNIRSDSLRNLIYWHAIEEIEHKHVAFDVLRWVYTTFWLQASSPQAKMCPQRLPEPANAGPQAGGRRASSARSGRAAEEQRHRRRRSVLNLVVCQTRSVVCLDRSFGRTCFAKDGETRSTITVMRVDPEQ